MSHLHLDCVGAVGPVDPHTSGSGSIGHQSRVSPDERRVVVGTPHGSQKTGDSPIWRKSTLPTHHPTVPEWGEGSTLSTRPTLKRRRSVEGRLTQTDHYKWNLVPKSSVRRRIWSGGEGRTVQGPVGSHEVREEGGPETVEVAVQSPD